MEMEALTNKSIWVTKIMFGKQGTMGALQNTMHILALQQMKLKELQDGSSKRNADNLKKMMFNAQATQTAKSTKTISYIRDAKSSRLTPVSTWLNREDVFRLQTAAEAEHSSKNWDKDLKKLPKNLLVIQLFQS